MYNRSCQQTRVDLWIGRISSVVDIGQDALYASKSPNMRKGKGPLAPSAAYPFSPATGKCYVICGPRIWAWGAWWMSGMHGSLHSVVARPGMATENMGSCRAKPPRPQPPGSSSRQVQNNFSKKAGRDPKRGPIIFSPKKSFSPSPFPWISAAVGLSGPYLVCYVRTLVKRSLFLWRSSGIAHESKNPNPSIRTCAACRVIRYLRLLPRVTFAFEQIDLRFQNKVHHVGFVWSGF